MKYLLLLAISLQLSAACVLDDETKLYWCAWDDTPAPEINKMQVRYCASGEAVVKTERGRPYCGKVHIEALERNLAESERKLRKVQAEVQDAALFKEKAERMLPAQWQDVECEVLEEKELVEKCLQSGWISCQGPPKGERKMVRLRCKPIEPTHAVTHGCKNCADEVATATPSERIPLTASFLP